jgi:hypothetical protein
MMTRVKSPADASSAATKELPRKATWLLAKAGCRGLFDLDIRRAERNGNYILFDFNPRLGTQFRMFPDTASTSAALAACLDLADRPGPPGGQLDGRGFLVQDYDPTGTVTHMRRSELRPRSRLASMRTIHETAWFARDYLRLFGLVRPRVASPWSAVSTTGVELPVTSGRCGGVPDEAAGPERGWSFRSSLVAIQVLSGSLRLLATSAM